MKYESVLETFRDGEIVIPMYMYKIFPSLDISLDSFIFLMYLRNKGDMISFDVPKFSSAFGKEENAIMDYIGELEAANLAEIKLIKNDKGIMEEFISIDGFYSKLGLNVVNNTNEEIKTKKEDTSNIFSILEKEIGKQLSPMEIEIVKGWKESNYSDDLIKEAIKEAVSNNVVTLRYIDKVLYAWDSKGITTVEEVDKNRKSFREKKTHDKKIEIYDNDDWLDGNEE